MFGRELLERAGDLPPQHRAFDRESLGILLIARLVQSQRGAHGGPPAHVDDRVARDLVEPGPDAAARRVVGLGMPPGTREDLLYDLLGCPPVPESVEREAVELPRVGAIKRTQRLAGGIRRNTGKKLGVGRHQPFGNTRRSAWRFGPIMVARMTIFRTHDRLGRDRSARRRPRTPSGS